MNGEGQIEKLWMGFWGNRKRIKLLEFQLEQIEYQLDQIRLEIE